MALLRSLTSKNDDSYENGASETSKTRTVARIVTWTPTIPVIVDTFESVGLAARGPYHGGGGGMGGGAVDTGHDTIYNSRPYLRPQKILGFHKKNYTIRSQN